MPTIRQAKEFEPSEVAILGLDFAPYSKTVLMEVLRGVGLSNDNVVFDTSDHLFEYGVGEFQANIIVLSHGPEEPFSAEMVCKLRRVDDREISETPMILLSSAATRSIIEQARDSGIDEVVIRPVAPAQLGKKLKQLIEAPRPFVTSANYVGPCRRRKKTGNYSGPSRRLDDYKEALPRDLPETPDASDLANAVSALRAACGELSGDRMGLVARVRETANRTMKLAIETKDIPLERTARAVRQYLEGVGSSNMIETHVLETGINALTQLSVLPNSYSGARQAVSNLMMVAVRKKLAHYQNRRLGIDSETEAMLSQINNGLTPPEDHSRVERLNIEEGAPKTPPKAARAQ